MDIKEYLQNPCGTLSIPYWKYRTLAIPDSIEIIHSRDWDGQYSSFRRYFRAKHDLNNLDPIGFDYGVISIDRQAEQLAGMINASYAHEGIAVSEEDILQWKNHETFREDLWVHISTGNGIMAASGIAEYDRICREGIIEWVQVLPEYRKKGLGKKDRYCFITQA